MLNSLKNKVQSLGKDKNELYEQALIKYGEDLAEYNKKIALWKKQQQELEEERKREEEFYDMDMDRTERFMLEDLLMQEEEKIRNLQILIDDEKVTEEQKRILNTIRQTIRDNPMTLESREGIYLNDPNE